VAIVDGRTLIYAFDSAASVVNVGGTAAGSTDTDTAIEGSPKTSVTFNLSNAVQGLLYNNGSTGVVSAGDHIYVWINIGVAGLLDTKAGGGLRFRFCGATIGDFFEVYIAGSDTYTGGWKMFVIDVDAAQSSPDNTGGTPPSIANVQYLGVVGDTNGAMTKKQDNFWVDAMWRLPSATPGIRVEGQNTGSVDWTWQDVVDASITGAWGTCERLSNGTIKLNTPIRFGANDAVTHGFSDTNEIVGFEDQPVATDLYLIEVIGGSGTQSFQLGLKTGTGDDATGAQGGAIIAPTAGVRFDFDADDANVDACNLYGVQFQHAGDFQLDDAAIETISCTFLDCSSATVSNSLFLRNSVVDANTADGVAFLTTDDLGDIKFSTFTFSDGHAVKLTTPRVATQASKGNIFNSYGAIGTNDAAVFNDTAGAVLIEVSDNGNTPTYRNGASASTTTSNPFSLTLTNLTAGTEIRVIRVSDNVELAGVESSGTTFVYNYEYVSDFDVKVTIQKFDKLWQQPVYTLSNANQTQKISQFPDLTAS